MSQKGLTKQRQLLDTICSKIHQHACGQILVKYCMEILYTSYVRVSDGNIKCQIGTLMFVLLLKLFRVTFANTDARSFKSLHKLFDTYFDYMLAKFEAKCMVQNVQI